MQGQHPRQERCSNISKVRVHVLAIRTYHWMHIPRLRRESSIRYRIPLFSNLRVSTSILSLGKQVRPSLPRVTKASMIFKCPSVESWTVRIWQIQSSRWSVCREMTRKISDLSRPYTASITKEVLSISLSFWNLLRLRNPRIFFTLILLPS